MFVIVIITITVIIHFVHFNVPLTIYEFSSFPSCIYDFFYYKIIYYEMSKNELIDSETV